jgi:hypothetical protein
VTGAVPPFQKGAFPAFFNFFKAEIRNYKHAKSTNPMESSMPKAHFHQEENMNTQKTS